MKYLRLALLGTLLACGACSSIDGEIADLREEETVLADKIRNLTEERKKLNSLISALQGLKRSDSASNEAKVEDARTALEERRDLNADAGL